MTCRPRCNKNPIYRVNNQGSVLHGSVADVIGAVKNGQDIRITSSSSSYTFLADNLAFDGSETEVAAQALWHVSQKLDVDHYVFQVNDLITVLLSSSVIAFLFSSFSVSFFFFMSVSVVIIITINHLSIISFPSIQPPSSQAPLLKKQLETRIEIPRLYVNMPFFIRPLRLGPTKN